MDKINQFHQLSSDRIKLSDMVKGEIMRTYNEIFIVIGGAKKEDIKFQTIFLD